MHWKLASVLNPSFHQPCRMLVVSALGRRCKTIRMVAALPRSFWHDRHSYWHRALHLKVRCKLEGELPRGRKNLQIGAGKGTVTYQIQEDNHGRDSVYCSNARKSLGIYLKSLIGDQSQSLFPLIVLETEENVEDKHRLSSSQCVFNFSILLQIHSMKF